MAGRTEFSRASAVAAASAAAKAAIGGEADGSRSESGRGGGGGGGVGGFGGALAISAARIILAFNARDYFLEAAVFSRAFIHHLYPPTFLLRKLVVHAK